MGVPRIHAPGDGWRSHTTGACAGNHGSGVKVRLATRNTSLAVATWGAGADIDRMYGCGPAVVCAVKMIFVTTILAPLTGFHQNAQAAAGQPWNILLAMDTRW